MKPPTTRFRRPPGYRYHTEFARQWYVFGGLCGLTEGCPQIKAHVVIQMATWKLGPVPETIQAVIRAAPDAEIDRIIERLFDARSVEALLGPG